MGKLNSQGPVAEESSDNSTSACESSPVSTSIEVGEVVNLDEESIAKNVE
jgi:hypothetical protein